jgi:hypothetical protein
MSLRFESAKDEQFEVCDADLIEGGDKDVIYTLRPLTAAKIREFHEIARREARTKRGGEVDEVKLTEDQLDYILVDWKGVEFLDGKPMPCERVYKLGDVKQGLTGLPLTRRALLLVKASEVCKATEAAKRESFREPETVR